MANLQRRLKNYHRQQARKMELKNSLKKFTGFKLDLSRIPSLSKTFYRGVIVITASAFIFYLSNIPQTGSYFSYLDESETVTINGIGSINVLGELIKEQEDLDQQEDLEQVGIEAKELLEEEDEPSDLEEMASEPLQGSPVTVEDDAGDSAQLGGDYLNEE